MLALKERYFEIFEEMSRIPHGSGNMEMISEWCLQFAKRCGLKAIKDDACNVVIYKNGTAGYENSEPVILQGHLDMVCQQAEGKNIDFEKASLDLFVDGDYIGARDTTLGGDDGIAVSLVLAILESSDISHPPIEAVFTTDEEIGMVGAGKLDMTLLSARRMINIDSEALDTITVSCAGGKDMFLSVPIERKDVEGYGVELVIDGLQGGHSGVEIDKNRVNANLLLARVLSNVECRLVTLEGGDKTNAIPRQAKALFVIDDIEAKNTIEENLKSIKAELSSREKAFFYKLNMTEKTVFNAIDENKSKQIITYLACMPNGIYEMSADIVGLVESSQNLGILKCTENSLELGISLRSSKKSALDWLEERMKKYSLSINAQIRVKGEYPAWEYNDNSFLQRLYKDCYFDVVGKQAKIEAIHAGLECGLFASKLTGLDCISVGPDMKSIHTVEERLKISSVKTLYEIILTVLKKLK